MKNALTIDLEDYYQVSAFAKGASVDHWEGFTSRIEQNTEKLLSLFEGEKRKATFFTLGWVARKYPKLVGQIIETGHEIACHSDAHHSVYTLTAEQFREDTSQAKKSLEDITGTAILGYRAPSFSITADTLWAFEILAELGFTYDSSIFPIQHLNYGMPHAPRVPFLIHTNTGPIVEFPMPTLQLGASRAPIAGGAYFRLLPYWYTSWGIKYLNAAESSPACIYLHPWELDSEQPRMNGSLTARMRHYFGLRATEGKFRRLLHDFEFQPMSSFVGDIRDSMKDSQSKAIPEVSLAGLRTFLGEEHRNDSQSPNL